MFNFFGKKPTALDAFIQITYGPNPPHKSADVQRAANLATDLLGGRVDFRDIKTLAEQLCAGPVPYSTHDLAASVALNFFRRPELMPQLGEVQISARMQVLDWFKAGHLNPTLARAFEDALYKDYKPFVNAAPPKARDNSPPPEKAETKYGDDVRYYLRHILTEEQWKRFWEIDEASPQSKARSRFQSLVKQEGLSPKQVAIFHACAFFGIDFQVEDPSERHMAIVSTIYAAADHAEALREP